MLSLAAACLALFLARGAEVPGPASLDSAYAALSKLPADKDPAPAQLEFLLRHYARTGDGAALERALQCLKSAGPGLRKAGVLLDAFQITRDAYFSRAARESLAAVPAEGGSAEVSALARGAQVLGDKSYLALAEKAVRKWKVKDAGAMLDLYEASFDPKWIGRAADQGESLLKGAKPSDSLALLRLSQFTGRKEFREAALAAIAGSAPGDFDALCALDFASAKPRHIILSGDWKDPSLEALLRVVRERYLPNKILIVTGDSESRGRVGRFLPFVKGAKPIRGKATAYICQNLVCEMPTADPREAAGLLDEKNAGFKLRGR